MNKRRNCKHCGNEFTPMKKETVHCSIKCKMESITKENKDTPIINGSHCKDHTYRKDKDGYGSMNYEGDKKLIHRVACEIKHGPHPTNKTLACHDCDRPECCNPDHLYWGDYSDNAQDRCKRNEKRFGEKAPCVKLTEDIVKDIIKDLPNYTLSQLGKKYNISTSNIKNIKYNKIWTHIPR